MNCTNYNSNDPVCSRFCKSKPILRTHFNCSSVCGICHGTGYIKVRAGKKITKTKPCMCMVTE